MNPRDFFSPSFLRPLDRKLLLNRPGLWMTQIHYLLFYAGMGVALAACYGMTREVRLDSVPLKYPAVNWMLIPAAVLLLVWGWRISRFINTAYQPSVRLADRLRDQGVYALAIAAACMIPVVHGEVLGARISALESKENVAKFRQILDETAPLFYEHSRHSRLTESAIDSLEQMLPEAIEIYRRFGNAPQDMTPEAVMQQFTLKDPESYSLWSSSTGNAYNNLYAISSAHNEDTRTSRYSVLIHIGIMVWLLGMILARAGMRNLLRLLLSAAGVWIVLYLTGTIVSGLYGGMGPGDLIALSVLLLSCFFYYQAIAQRSLAKNRNQRMLSLSLVAIMLPFIPVFGVEKVVDAAGDPRMNELEPLYTAWALLLTVVLSWNLLFERKFIYLSARPSDT